FFNIFKSLWKRLNRKARSHISQDPGHRIYVKYSPFLLRFSSHFAFAKSDSVCAKYFRCAHQAERKDISDRYFSISRNLHLFCPVLPSSAETSSAALRKSF